MAFGPQRKIECDCGAKAHPAIGMCESCFRLGQREMDRKNADAELGRMVRQLAEKRRSVIIGASVVGGWICKVGMAEKKPAYAADTLDEAVRKALEATNP